MRNAVLGLALLLAGCGASPAPRVTPELVSAAQHDDREVGQSDLERGRTVYTTSCASCHALPRVDDYDAPTWRRWMRAMAPKAKLDQDQAQDVLRYLLAARSLAGGG